MVEFLGLREIPGFLSIVVQDESIGIASMYSRLEEELEGIMAPGKDGKQSHHNIALSVS